MRVVQLLPELNEGGVERGVVELNRELVKLGVESIVISAGGKLARQIDIDGGQHVSFDVVSKNPLTAPARVLRLRNILKELNPDILHARSRVPAWLAYLANKKLNMPFVTTVHGFNSVNAYSRVMTFGDRVICVSSAVKKYIQEHYQVPDGKIDVIPRGIDLEFFHPDHLDQEFIDTFRSSYQLEDKFVVSSVGRITQLKDYETFIRAVSFARSSRPDIVGLVVGGVHPDRANYFKDLQLLVEGLGATEFIKFVGSQKNIAEIYFLSDLVVSCSKKPESFGRSAAEAIAMGTPVLATNHGGIVDVVKEDVCGSLFAVGDSEVLAAHMVMQKAMDKENMRDFIAREFSLAQMVEKTVLVYDSF